MAALGQTISTVSILRERNSTFSGIPERERDFRVISTEVFMFGFVVRVYW